MQQSSQGKRSKKPIASKSDADMVRAKQTETATSPTAKRDTNIVKQTETSPSPESTREALQVDKPTGEVHIRIEPLEKPYTDQAGKFPIPAASGN